MSKAKYIRTVFLAGAGVMGASFAQIFARNGYDVLLFARNESSLDKARQLIAVNQASEVEQGVRTAQNSAELVSHITYTNDKMDMTKAQFILESIPEQMEVKHAFWKEVCEIVDENVILATNTSGLSITEIAKAVKNPGRFAGMHWINPPHLIPLVEVIAGNETDDETVDVICDLGSDLGQKPVRVYKDPAGFVLNRLQYALVREAFHIVQQGYASMADVDEVMKAGLGLRYACIGPFETIDFGGIDIFNFCGSYLFDALCNDGGLPPLLKQAYDEGKLGVKNGKGFYDYSDGKDVEALAARDAKFIAVSRALYGE